MSSVVDVCMSCVGFAEGGVEEPKAIGLAMVPGQHIVAIQVDDTAPEVADPWPDTIHTIM